MSTGIFEATGVAFAAGGTALASRCAAPMLAAPAAAGLSLPAWPSLFFPLKMHP